MLFSFDWLIELCPAGRDVAEVAEALTARGLTVDSVEPRGVDHTLDVDVPANRPDCLGHLGLAREIGAAFGVPLAARPASPADGGMPAADAIRVEIEDETLCPRYTARLIRGVRVGPSPEWVVQRLETCGLRSLNNVVDASNLVLLGTGHPIHFFDLAKLSPPPEGDLPTIRVRRATAGEKLVTLDGVEHRLAPEMLVIADGRRAVALAGVMGGADSEIGDSTREVLSEAACFAPRSVRSTSRQLGLQTDASYRFERGVDPAGLADAQSFAVHLLHELCDGVPAPGLVDVGRTTTPDRRQLTLRIGQVERLLGYAPPLKDMQQALESLGLRPRDTVADRMEVSVPSWRRDLDREADLVEEIARHVGYDGIPTAGAVTPAPSGEGQRDRAADRCRDLLADLGFHEALGYAMIASGEDDRFAEPGAAPAIALSNPIASQLSHLRRSILPGLLQAADLNVRRGTLDARLFEVGRVFAARGPGQFPEERLRLGLAWTGAAEPRHWERSAREVGLFDVMGVIEHIVGVLRPGLGTRREPGAYAAFHPGRSVTWHSELGVVAWGGALHPEVQHGFDRPILMAECNLDVLAAGSTSARQHEAVPRFPAVTRDLSLVLTADVTYARLIEALESVEPPAAARFAAVDRYTGDPLPPGEASLTVRVTLRPSDRALTNEETESYRSRLLEVAAERLGVRIRA